MERKMEGGGEEGTIPAINYSRKRKRESPRRIDAGLW